MTEYYDILEINKNCDQNEIKKSYRKLALKWHPDKNKSPEAIEMFKKINEAYDILSDPEKRKIYDQFGKDGLNNKDMQFDPNNMFNMFNSMFGEHMNFNVSGFGFQSQQRSNIELVEHITLNDIFTGKTVKKTFSRKSFCVDCNSTGSSDGKEHTCKICNGRRFVQQHTRMGSMLSISTVQCPTCNGRGYDNGTHNCPKCNGEKFINESFSFDLTIPFGFTENDAIIKKNIGHYDLSTKTRGDVIIKINVMRDQNFIRNAMVNGQYRIDGYDLLTRVHITLAESLCGFTHTIKHVDNRNIIFNMSDIVKNNDLYIIENEGLQTKEKDIRGKLYVIFIIDYVDKLTIEQKKIIWHSITGTELVELNEKQCNSRIIKSGN